MGMDFGTGLKFLLQAPGLTSRPTQPSAGSEVPLNSRTWLLRGLSILKGRVSSPNGKGRALNLTDSPTPRLLAPPPRPKEWTRNGTGNPRGGGFFHPLEGSIAPNRRWAQSPKAPPATAGQGPGHLPPTAPPLPQAAQGNPGARKEGFRVRAGSARQGRGVGLMAASGTPARETERRVTPRPGPTLRPSRPWAGSGTPGPIAAQRPESPAPQRPQQHSPAAGCHRPSHSSCAGLRERSRGTGPASARRQQPQPAPPRRAPPTLKETSSHFALFAEKVRDSPFAAWKSPRQPDAGRMNP